MLLIAKIGETNSEILKDQSFDEKIQSLAKIIVTGCNLDSKYNPAQDIEWFISTLPGPDVLIITGNDMGPAVYSSHPEMLNSVSIVHADTDSFQEITPIPIIGTPDDWRSNYEGIGLVGFLEEFILRNT